MSKKYIFLYVFFLLSVGAKSQSITIAEPQDVSVSSDILAKIDTLVTKYIEEKKLPGGVFLIARKGAIVYEKSFGYRNSSTQTPYQNNDIFRIASMTKAVTACAIMQLYENGDLNLDDAIKKYIKAFENTQVLNEFDFADSSYTTVAPNKDITIRHLLTHTSGIVYGDFSQGKIKAMYAKHDMLKTGLSHKTWTTEEFINRLAKVPLAFQPGEKFNYGLNMDVLGRIIEVVSGQSLSDYFEKYIFEPLGMAETHFYLPKHLHQRLVPVYAGSETGFELVEKEELLQAVSYPTDENHNFYAGGGGLSCTANNYHLFIQALIHGGELNGKRILKEETIAIMASNQMAELNALGRGNSDSEARSFNHGFMLWTDKATGIKSPGTYEWGGYFNTRFFIDPKKELTFVGMAQIVPFQHASFWNELTEIIYDALID